MRTDSLTGQRFGKLFVLCLSYVDRNSHWECLCDCGEIVIVSRPSLTSGHTSSCGCYRRSFKRIHGHSTNIEGRTPEYSSWNAMIQRCCNPNEKAYHNYGGRGIKVCRRWLKFANFLADMGKRPTKTTLERKDNDRGYYKANCTWADRRQQSLNRRETVWLTAFGRTQCLKDWAREIGITDCSLAYRLRVLKLPLEEALTRPRRRALK